MLKDNEVEAVIKRPLQKILDELNNHVSRETYAELQKTLNDAYKLIKAAVIQKGE